MNNLELWNSVVTTDPNYTKQFSRGGGFKGTSTNATYLIRKATERFGPVGIGWGADVIDERYFAGAPIAFDNSGVPVAHETLHIVRIRIWYLYGAERERGEYESYGQTTIVGKNKHGLYTDEEAPKKSFTDALTKGLSWLGFAGDVHLGLYDDNKYVSNLQDEFQPGRGAKGGEDEKPDPAAKMIATFTGAANLDELRKAKEAAKEQCGNNSALWQKVSAHLKKRLAELQPKEAANAPAQSKGTATKGTAAGAREVAEAA